MKNYHRKEKYQNDSKDNNLKLERDKTSRVHGSWRRRSRKNFSRQERNNFKRLVKMLMANLVKEEELVSSDWGISLINRKVQLFLSIGIQEAEQLIIMLTKKSRRTKVIKNKANQ